MPAKTYSNYLVGGVLFVLLFILLAGLIFLPNRFITSTTTYASGDRVSQLNAQIDQLSRVSQRSGLMRKQTTTPDTLKNIIFQRKTLLLDQARRDPQAFLNNTLSPSVRSRLLSDVKPLLEKETIIRGVIKIVHIDYADKKRSGQLYTIQSNSSSYTLRSAKIKFADFARKQVTVKGFMLGNEMVVQDVQALAAAPVSPATPIGDQKTIVMLVNFTTKQQEPVTTNQVRGIVFSNPSSVNAFYKENSFNQTSFSGDVVGWYTLADDGASCEDSYISWADQADARATAQGINLSTYQRKVYAMLVPRDCPWGGLADLAISPSRAWILAEAYLLDKPIYAHELGHNLGMNHAASRDCKPYQISNTCLDTEYGDLYDVMSAANLYHVNGPHKVQMGWVPETRVQTVTQNGTYIISSLETNRNTIQVLRVMSPGTSRVYYVEFRQSYGYDELIPSEATRGILIHLWMGQLYESTKLIDTTPGSPQGFQDASLQDGFDFSDPENHITIKQISHTITTATIQVTIIPLSISPTPTITPTPACQVKCDVNGDGVENLTDGPFATSCWGKKGNLGNCVNADIDCNGQVNVVDIQKFTFTCPQIFIQPTAVAFPSPTVAPTKTP
ncbi:MAG: hypothetical protein Q7S61_00410 [bacterium]|nr:hypothetical protein [bacterium]